VFGKGGGRESVWVREEGRACKQEFLLRGRDSGILGGGGGGMEFPLEFNNPIHNRKLALFKCMGKGNATSDLLYEYMIDTS
jgi:hypothetical protein